MADQIIGGYTGLNTTDSDEKTAKEETCSSGETSYSPDLFRYPQPSRHTTTIDRLFADAQHNRWILSDNPFCPKDDSTININNPNNIKNVDQLPSRSLLSPYAPVFQISSTTRQTELIDIISTTRQQLSLDLPLHWKPGLLLAGDFNSTPDSAVYQLMLNGSCDRRHSDLCNTKRVELLTPLHLGHSLSLKSSHAEVIDIKLDQLN